MRMNIWIYITLLCVLVGCTPSSKNIVPQNEIDVIPLPNRYEVKPGVFRFTEKTSISFSPENEELSSIANLFVEKTTPAFGFRLGIKKQEKNAVILRLEEDTALGDEGYKIEVGNTAILLTAHRPHGIFNAMQTLYQLLPAIVKSPQTVNGAAWEIGCMTIQDEPAFAWRGLMLDVSRHFFTKKEILRLLDQMSEYKYNVFHWHLTDDQGWRIEIKSRPQLTAVGAWRPKRVGNWWEREAPKLGEECGYGGFYSQSDILEIVEYAKQRYISVVPEIDVPGHSMAALAAYPELSCTGRKARVNVGNTFYTKDENTLCVGSEETYKIMGEILDEVALLFPFEYIHLGGDECFGGFWEKCPKCRKCMADNKLKSIAELQTHFMNRMAQWTKKHQKTMIVWDEIVEGGLPKDAVVMSWRGVSGAIKAASHGHRVILTPSENCYLDLYQGDPLLEPNTYSRLQLKDCYRFDMLPKEIKTDYILGGQGNLWTESVPHYRQAEYMIWPRAMALAETFWSVLPSNNWEFFVGRVENHFQRLSLSEVNYARSIFDPIVSVKNNESKELLISITSELPNAVLYHTFDNTNPDQYSPIYNKPLTVPANASMFKVVTYRKGKPVGKQLDITIAELKRRATQE